jgi:uncharacterized repeat protein (TIGR03806 family)
MRTCYTCFGALALAIALLLGACGKSSSTAGQVTTTPQSADDIVLAIDTAVAEPTVCNDCGQLLPVGVGASPCSIDGDLPVASGIKFVPVFTKIGISQPIHLTHPHDGTDRIVVVARPGRIYLFNNDTAAGQKTVVLNISDKVNTKGEGGLLSVAYHPNYKTTRRVYVNYTSKGEFRTIVSEFTANASDVLEPGSERVLLSIKQPYSNHDGGHILFDSAGHLLVGMGDGGAANDPLNAGQNFKSMLGKILRIDVNNKSNGKQYAIPADNPFVESTTHLPEIYATGMRNPWRMTVDSETGDVWAGDVGQNKYEEIDLIVSGGNYGWRRMEGAHCFNPSKNCNPGDLIDPVVDIPQKDGSTTVARSITGGDVYRGSKQPGLVGAYIFGDYVSGRFWTTRKVKKDGKWTFPTQQVATTSYKPVSFGSDRNGEMFMVQLGGSATIFRVAEVLTTPANPVPPRLSKTGCFVSLSPLKAAEGLVPYEVNAPLWSDGAGKARWLVLPKGAKPNKRSTADNAAPPITANKNDLLGWDLPVGSIAIKHFYRQGAPGQAGHLPMETRFIQRRADDWRMLTYTWDQNGKDATLALGGGVSMFNGKDGDVAWRYPSTGDCKSCHAAETPTKFLGLHSAQLDGARTATGHNQVDIWLDAGLLGKYDPKASHTRFADPRVEGGDIGTRARTYLHVQCASCHQPNSSASTDLDLRFGAALKATGSCGNAPQKGDLGVAGAKLLAVGDPAKSLLTLRMKTTDESQRMPAKGVSITDQIGVTLLEAWIKSLKDCQ